MAKFRLTNRTTGRTTAELKADVKTIKYELAMLLNAAQWYGEARADDAVGRNLAIQSFAVNCRALIQFLFGHLEWIERPGKQQERFPPPRPTDVFAHDYYAGWQQDCPTPTETMGDSKWRADKHVAHITIDRRGVNQPGTGTESVWQLKATVEEICMAMAVFVTRAPASNFEPADLQEMKARLAPWLAVTTPPPVAFNAKSGPLDPPTINPQTPGFNQHGKTE